MKTLILASLLWVSTAQAVPALTESNDWGSSFLAPSDKGYTQGLELSSTRKFEEAYAPVQFLSSLLPQIACGVMCERTPQLAGWGIGQQIHTPSNRDSIIQDPDDEPYAGWLYLRATRMNQTSEARISTSLYAGMVGTAALGREAQNGVHNLLGQKEWMGWRNQLTNEPAFYLNHKRSYIDWRGGGLYGAIFIHSLEANLGTVHTDATVKAELRAGYNLRGYNLDNKEFAVYAFARPGGSVVLRNIFLDGNTFLDSYRVQHEWVQAIAETGLGIEYYGWRILYMLNFTTKDFSTQKDAYHGYGTVKIEKLFE